VILSLFLNLFATAMAYKGPYQLLARSVITPPQQSPPVVNFGKSVVTKGGWLAVASKTAVFLYVRGATPPSEPDPNEHYDDFWVKTPIAKLSTGDEGFGTAVAIEVEKDCTSEHGACGITIVVGTGSPSNKAFIFECPAHQPSWNPFAPGSAIGQPGEDPPSPKAGLPAALDNGGCQIKETTRILTLLPETLTT